MVSVISCLLLLLVVPSSLWAQQDNISKKRPKARPFNTLEESKIPKARPTENVEYYCKFEGTGYFRPITSYDCMEQVDGAAFCRQASSPIPELCGDFSIRSGDLVVKYKHWSGKTKTTNLGRWRMRPSTKPAFGDDVSSMSETTNGLGYDPNIPLDMGSINGLENHYPPRKAAWSTGIKETLDFTNEAWLKLGIVEQAKHVHKIYQTLLPLHGFEKKYSAEVLTCKAVHESFFSCNGTNKIRKRCKEIGYPLEFRTLQTQYQSAILNSDASGMSAVLESTAIDLFNRGYGFRSKVTGFEDITDGAKFHARMAGHQVAQLELGIGVFHQKSIDSGSSSVYKILWNYLGNARKPWCNDRYASKIQKCERCIKSNGFTTKCLTDVVGLGKGC